MPRPKRHRPQSADNESQLASFLVLQVMLGAVSPQFCQQAASLVVEDMSLAIRKGLVLNDLISLAELGDRGQHPGNASRDLHRLTCRSLLPAADHYRLPLKSKLGRGWSDYVQSVWLPHVVFASFYGHCYDYFCAKFIPGLQTLPLFWASQVGNPQYEHHSVKRRDLSLAIPIAIHGDAVPSSGVGKVRSKSLDILNWSSYLARGASSEVMYLIYGVFVHLVSQV